MIIEKLPKPESQQEPTSEVFPWPEFQRPDLLWSHGTGSQFHRGPQRKWIHQFLWSWIAVVIDLLVVVGLSCLFSWVFLKTFGVHTASTQMVFVSSFTLNFINYYLCFFVFLGGTLGMWSCGFEFKESAPTKTEFHNEDSVKTGPQEWNFLDDSDFSKGWHLSTDFLENKTHK